MRSGRRKAVVRLVTMIVALTCGALSVVAAGHGPARATPAGSGLVERQRYAMGTMFAIVVRMPGGNVDAGAAAVDEALDAVARLDRVLSHYDAGSDLSRLAARGARGAMRVDPDLYLVIERSLEMSRLSQGRFDITVGPYVRLWRDARERGRPPSASELAGAASCTGSDRIALLPPDRIQLHADCMALDLGGIGKGYAVDRAIEVLRMRGIAHAVVNAGGSTIKAIGTSGQYDGWPVAATWRRDADDLVLLRDLAMSTSLASGEVIVPGRRAPSDGTLAVSVTTPSATMADALSTSLLLSTIDEGQAMLRQVPRASAWWTRPDGTVQAQHLAPAASLAASGDTR